MAEGKSNLEIWAENEIRIACERERAGDGEWDHGVACYESALRAFKSLLKDGHSGLSIGITKGILNALIDGEPLTPIEDTEDAWNEARFFKEGCKTYQCKRMSSLFKDVYEDGRVEYTDVDRFICRDLESKFAGWHNGWVDKIVGEVYPITFPYVAEKYRVYCREHLVDRKNGDYDTLAILYVENKYGETRDIYRYFAETEDGWDEICEGKWRKRVRMHEERERKEAEER